MPKFFIKHITQYNYSSLIIDGANQIKLHPIENDYCKVLSHTLSINTNPKIKTRKDFYGNTVGTFMVIEPHSYLSIISEIEVNTLKQPKPTDTKAASEQWMLLKSLKHDPKFIDYLKYITFDGTPEIKRLIDTKNFSNITPYEFVLSLSEYIFTNFKYIQGVTQVNSKLDHVWKIRSGVCQDFTIILLQMIRMAGIPARYISGYICPNEEGSRGEGATHAWVEAYIPFFGWLGLDPTNNTLANEYHVKLAVGPHYKDCTPVKGVYKGNVKDNLFVNVKVSTEKSTYTLDSNVIIPQKEDPNTTNNSYRRNLEFIQQQQ